jgi:hypothetical protein
MLFLIVVPAGPCPYNKLTSTRMRYVLVGISFRVVIIKDRVRDAASSECIFDVDWNL